MSFKVSAIPAPAAPSSDPQVERLNSVRSIKMSVNQTPVQPTESATVDEKSPIPNATETQTSEETKPLSPQLAELAKQRRALQVKEREIQEREKALSASASKTDGWIDPAQLKSSPLSVMLQHGVTYDQLTEAILADQAGHNPDIEALKAEIKALKEGVDKTLTDRDSKQEQQVLAEMKREATLLAATGDEFEMVRETGSIPDVMTLIEKTYRETGEVLEVKEALRLVEEELIKESLKIANIKKVQSRLQPAPTAKPQPAMRTLTNRDASQQSTMSAKQRALAAFAGTLKK